MPAKTIISLHHLVHELVTDVLLFAVKRRNLIINDVHPDLHAYVDEQRLAIILKKLLCHIVMNTQDNCIRVTAKSYSSITLVHVRNNDFNCEKMITNYLQQLKGIAEQLGGCLDITNNKLHGTTVSFTFLNLRQVI